MSLYNREPKHLYKPNLCEMEKYEPELVDELKGLYGTIEYFSEGRFSLNMRLENNKDLLPYEIEAIKRKLDVFNEHHDLTVIRAEILSLKLRVLELIHTYNLAKEIDE